MLYINPPRKTEMALTELYTQRCSIVQSDGVLNVVQHGLVDYHFLPSSRSRHRQGTLAPFLYREALEVDLGVPKAAR